MWMTNQSYEADLVYAMRMVLTGHATPEQAAQTCGLTLGVLREALASCPQLRLQEVERSA